MPTVTRQVRLKSVRGDHHLPHQGLTEAKLLTDLDVVRRKLNVRAQSCQQRQRRLSAGAAKASR